MKQDASTALTRVPSFVYRYFGLGCFAVGGASLMFGLASHLESAVSSGLEGAVEGLFLILLGVLADRERVSAQARERQEVQNTSALSRHAVRLVWLAFLLSTLFVGGSLLFGLMDMAIGSHGRSLSQHPSTSLPSRAAGPASTVPAAPAPGVRQNMARPTPAERALPTCSPGKFRVAAIQLVSEFGNLKRNRERLAALVRAAACNGAQVVVAPECAVPGYMSADHRRTWRDPVRRPNPKDGRSLVEADAAEAVPGESTRVFGELARELKVRIVVGLIEKVETAAAGAPRTDYYNTAVLLSPAGRVECHYRKLNLWPPGDATWAQEGNLGLGVCGTELGKFGVMICFDQTCGTAEKLKAAGATTVLYPIAWVHDKPSEDWFEGRLPERVKMWGVNVVGANWALDHVPPDPNGPQGFGCSRIIAADGTILARAGPAGNEIIYADLPKP